MDIDEVSKRVKAAVVVTREDIARAKGWVVPRSGGTTYQLVEDWLTEQKATIPVNSKVNLTAQDVDDQIARYARGFGLRLAFYQALWELIGAGELLPADSPGVWEASLGFKSGGHSGGLDVKGITCSYPEKVIRPPLAPEAPTDPDIFLRGVDCATLHDGILEAIEQALVCFRRGLYLPATAMLAAAAEATWTECAAAIAKRPGYTALANVLADPLASINKKVIETKKALQTADGRSLLKTANSALADVEAAELWTTNLRERRNALHWGKAKSFVADHSETASLLMAAPLHLRTLEAIRKAC